MLFWFYSPILLEGHANHQTNANPFWENSMRLKRREIMALYLPSSVLHLNQHFKLFIYISIVGLNQVSWQFQFVELLFTLIACKLLSDRFPYLLSYHTWLHSARLGMTRHVNKGLCMNKGLGLWLSMWTRNTLNNWHSKSKTQPSV